MSDNPWPLERKSPFSWWRFLLLYLPAISLTLLLGGFAALVLWPYVVVNINSGEVGVVWKRFGCGTVMDPNKLRDQGVHVIPPWDVVFPYNLRVQSTTDTYRAISSDGVGLDAKVNIRFLLEHDFIPLIHEAFGPNYIETAIKPEIGGRAREVISRHTSEEVYTRRSVIENEIKSLVEAKMHAMITGMTTKYPKGVLERGCQQKVTDDNRPNLALSVKLASILVLDIELPLAVVAAINRKIEQLYISQEYVYRVERERKESERKQIEAVGIRDFQQTVSQGISDSYLRWRGIEATLQLAQSNNSKIVVIGSGRDGVPIILGNVDTPSAPSPAPAPSEGATAKPIAASPATPTEKTRASGLSTPSERTPSSGSSGSPSSEPEKPSPSLFPGLTVLKTLYEHAFSPTEPGAKPAESKPAKASFPTENLPDNRNR
jgi:regulator of protease activity HflC (stomatin/prohibitin superfamily)